MIELVECCFTSTETVGLLGTGAQDGHLDFHTAPELCTVLVLKLSATFTEGDDRFAEVMSAPQLTRYRIKGHADTKTSVHAVTSTVSDLGVCRHLWLTGLETSWRVSMP